MNEETTTPEIPASQAEVAPDAAPSINENPHVATALAAQLESLSAELEASKAASAEYQAKIANLTAPDPADDDLPDDPDDQYASIKHAGERKAARKRDQWKAKASDAESRLEAAEARNAALQNQIMISRLQAETGQSPQLLSTLMPGLRASGALDGAADDMDGAVKKAADAVRELLPETGQAKAQPKPSSLARGVIPSDKTPNAPIDTRELATQKRAAYYAHLNKMGGSVR